MYETRNLKSSEKYSLLFVVPLYLTYNIIGKINWNSKFYILPLFIMYMFNIL